MSINTKKKGGFKIEMSNEFKMTALIGTIVLIFFGMIFWATKDSASKTDESKASAACKGSLKEFHYEYFPALGTSKPSFTCK